MYVINEIAYAGEQAPAIKVKAVRPLDGYKLWARFASNEEKIFDFAPLLDYPCYAPLKDKTAFNSVYVDFGCPVWNDGAIDIAPERVYQDGVTVNSAVHA
ncbi:MAG: DUF2442 domain-containing protein [Ruthenibacterium sp.]